MTDKPMYDLEKIRDLPPEFYTTWFNLDFPVQLFAEVCDPYMLKCGFNIDKIIQDSDAVKEEIEGHAWERK